MVRARAKRAVRACEPPRTFRTATPLRLGRLERKTVVAESQELRRAIEAGELSPGARLPSERDLAHRYGTARNTAREAIRLLILQRHFRLIM
jgi:DNA-binding GntR family transcriptional regulator